MTSLHKVLESTVVNSPSKVASSPLKIRLILTPAKPDGSTKRSNYFKVTKILLEIISVTDKIIHPCCVGDITILSQPQQQRSRVSTGGQSGDFTVKTRMWSAEIITGT